MSACQTLILDQDSRAACFEGLLSQVRAVLWCRQRDLECTALQHFRPNRLGRFGLIIIAANVVVSSAGRPTGRTKSSPVLIQACRTYSRDTLLAFFSYNKNWITLPTLNPLSTALHEFDSGAEFFGDDLASYRKCSISCCRSYANIFPTTSTAKVEQSVTHSTVCVRTSV